MFTISDELNTRTTSEEFAELYAHAFASTEDFHALDILTDDELAAIDADIDAGMYDDDNAWVGEYMSLDELNGHRLAEDISDEYSERLFSAERY